MFRHAKTKFDKLIKEGKKTTHSQLLPLAIKNRLNTYSPLVGAGIRIKTVDLDNGLCVVTLPLTRLNRYTGGIQFSGSVMMLTEPLLRVLLTHRLGKNYTVQDKSMQVEFFGDIYGDITARVRLDTEQLLEIIEQVATEGEIQRVFCIDITDNHQKVVARVTRTFVIALKNKPV
ncbi:protein of unknown function [Moraxella cuniculi DSM 21768]|uniref:Acyl-coenzyme A thioesterase PaaI, contains HGG motif n=1 Tax=Moraxella cuniculi DSM 21768 TaxID=1122245 RepID=A0A1N7F6J1_9GAMM|nr:DUF4442 domain-containing protein [Moraxella cuniculi]OOS06450.1 hypothetical protein B0189_05055 [Moraxella cuniculi]SIR95855.1 protein of unknown function [Moraxella cuniculi DSM 21768]